MSTHASALLESSASASAEYPTSANYKPCDCVGRSPIRGCRICFSAHWLKRCPDCWGEGTLVKPARQTSAQGRTERCGFCMGTGWVPCPKAEIAQAELETGLAAEPAPTSPPPAATAKRIQTRRQQIKKSKKSPLRKSAITHQVNIAAERPQNPVEAMEIYEEGDKPASEPASEPTAAEPREVAPSSFGPSDDLPPSAA